jgi:hypothetical protein
MLANSEDVWFAGELVFLQDPVNGAKFVIFNNDSGSYTPPLHYIAAAEAFLRALFPGLPVFGFSRKDFYEFLKPWTSSPLIPTNLILNELAKPSVSSFEPKSQDVASIRQIRTSEGDMISEALLAEEKRLIERTIDSLKKYKEGK